MDLKEIQKRVARENLFNSACHAHKSGMSYSDWESHSRGYAKKHEVTDCLEHIFELVWNTKRSMFCE